jgi:acyl-coenzyme A synthetase/AMP-(fatty) acid ligase/predicted hotdog family 3-hydroxylacyl-ACP dehydratase
VKTLSRWFAAEPRGDRLVAFGREGERSDADLYRDVAALAAHLAPAAGRDVLVHCDDAYAFAVGLFACARAGARAVLAPSRQPGMLRELAQKAHGALCDGDPPRALADLPCWHPLEAARAGGAGAAPVFLDRNAPLAVLFTSGSTGEARRVEKAVRHLEDEVAVLEGRFGAQLGADARILATVAPQHLYGLLFRILWPIASGRAFLRSAVLHPEELAPHSGDAPFAVVTTPVTLRHLVERGELSRRRAGCRAIFSSGGPLAAELARRTAESLGHAPFEVYGSTETGGVAVRQQQSGDEPWQPMPGVVAETDAATGCLAVRSPFVSAGEPGAGPERFVTGDRAAFTDTGAFHLLGRADRVIKVGEKRLSLPDMEERLRAHPAVADAVLLGLEKGAGEARVAAVVVPAASAWDAVAADGRRALARTLTDFLAEYFERVLLPRAWRFVAALPSNAQGKLTQDALRALFAAESSPDALERLDAARAEHSLELRLLVPWDLAYLDGHFPGAPVVAGAVQVHFAMRALEELLGAPAQVAALEALKFHDVLLPGQELLLRVERSGRDRFEFAVDDAQRPERRFASGRGTLGARGLAATASAAISGGAFAPIAELLPHAGAMRLLESVLAHGADGTRCAVASAHGALFRDARGAVPAWVALEYMAQCAAVDGSLRGRAHGGTPEPALLVGSRRVAFGCAEFDPAQRLEVTARHAAGRRELLAFDCAVCDADSGEPLAEARLNVLPGLSGRTRFSA